jgi:predicted O-methyltransferase YrrM
MARVNNRLELAQFLRDSGYKVGAEVGVFDGYYSEILCQQIPDLDLYSIDPWQAYPGYGDHMNQKRLINAYELAQVRLKPYPRCQLVKKFSIEAAKDFVDGSLDFVYIDANHGYGHVKEDLKAWTPKVREGGVVCGDDYYMMRSGNIGVIRAVNEFVEEHGYDLQTTPWDLKNPKEDDRQPQWFLIK